ncbi:MAG: hypothetical protein J6Z03_00700, partial [Erysipelotrichaceae bacterium]|nr:hypothetical protein [Erysipelotrichaceae bacterium]
MAILMAMGYLFRKIDLFDDGFVAKGKKFCFYVLLSSSLFKNLYDTSLAALDPRLIIYVVVCILLEYVVAMIIARRISDDIRKQGVIIQGAM